MNPLGDIPRHARRAGMTLIELLIAALVTAIVAITAATLLNATSNASTQSRNAREVSSAGNYVIERFNEYVREARAFGQITSTGMSFWIGDTNNNDTIELSETAVIYYDATNLAIVFRTFSPTSTADATVPTATFTNWSTLDLALRAAGDQAVQWATDVRACVFSGYPAGTDARLANLQFTLSTGSDATNFLTSASPRAAGDYLFVNAAHQDPSGSQTRVLRVKVSPYGGISTAN